MQKIEWCLSLSAVVEYLEGILIVPRAHQDTAGGEEQHAEQGGWIQPGAAAGSTESLQPGEGDVPSHCQFAVVLVTG